jgi:hypothetical protein
MEEPKERLEIKKLARREKTKKMRMVCLGFTGSPSKNIIVVAEFVSKHGHPSFNGTNPNDASTELPRVDHYGKNTRRLDRMEQTRATRWQPRPLRKLRYNSSRALGNHPRSHSVFSSSAFVSFHNQAQ